MARILVPLLLLTMAVPVFGAAPTPRIDATPHDALVDEPVRIRLSGLAPNQTVTVRAHARDELDRTWASSATFQADAKGRVDAGAQSPVSGTYTGVDATGLIWSMGLPPDEAQRQPFAFGKLSPIAVTIEAEIDGRQIASAQVVRRLIAPGVERVPVRERGLVGTLFEPATGRPRPAVLVLGGSGGGVNEPQAALLASHGFTALALAYFNYEGVPKDMIEIPLEYFGGAIEWLRVRPGVRAEKIGVMGTSRGGELALLLGATYPEVRAVVAFVPSAVAWGGVSPEPASVDKPAWTYRGQPLPFLAREISPIEKGEPVEGPTRMAPYFLSRLADREAVARAAIPVEKIRGPVLLLTGADDHIWPSTLMAEMVVKRLAEHKHQFAYSHVSYPEAGHNITYPGVPTTGWTSGRHPIRKHLISSGGTPAGAAHAASDAWRQVVSFFRSSLGG